MTDPGHNVKIDYFKILANPNWTESWNFRPKGDGRSGPSGPLLLEIIVNIFNMLNIEKGRLFWLIVTLYLENCAIIMLPLDHIGIDFAILFPIAMEG